MSSQLHVSVFAFSITRIATRGVRPVIHTCFLFSVCENRNAKAVVPGTGIPIIESGCE